MQKLALSTVFPALLVSSLACEGSDGETLSDFAQAATVIEGIYKVDRHDFNAATCAPGGQSLRTEGSDTFAIATLNTALGVDFLYIISCEDPEDCRARAEQAGGFSVDFSYTLSALDGQSLSGEGASTGFGNGEICEDGTTTATTLDYDGSSISIELGETLADPYPATSDGFCTTALAIQAAQGNPCSRMETMGATFVEPR